MISVVAVGRGEWGGGRVMREDKEGRQRGEADSWLWLEKLMFWDAPGRGGGRGMGGGGESWKRL